MDSSSHSAPCGSLSRKFRVHPRSSPVFAAWEHCGCQWLLKVDIEDFFHNISEGQISAVFYRLGYPRLLAFELARLTTFCPSDSKPSPANSGTRWPAIKFYQAASEGILPQGAPTSPMLSNLVMVFLDERLTILAAQYGMRYTRYADDLAFSCRTGKERAQIERFKRLVLDELSKEGFRHNRRKTVIRGPGTRRIVLGMLVDGPRPRLPGDFKDLLRLHLHYLKSAGGPSQHAIRQKTSVSALYHHVRGLIDWAAAVEPTYGARALTEFQAIEWPQVQPRRRDQSKV